MKKILILLIFLADMVSVSAQNASPAKSLEISGVKVIFKPTIKKTISVRMYYRGGTANYNADKAGLDNFTLAAAPLCGNQKYSANAFRDSSDKYGIVVSGSSELDYGFIQLSCISKYFDRGWDMFSETVLNPVFEDNEVKLLRAKLIAGSNAEMGVGHNKLNELLFKSTFNTTPYGINPKGDEETLNTITTADLKNHYKSILNKNQLFIVVVGNITKEQLTEKVLFSFGNLPSKPYYKKEFDAPQFLGGQLMMEKRQYPLNFVQGLSGAPAVSSPEYIPYRLALSALSNNLHYTVNLQQKLASGPFAICIPRQMSLTQIVFTTAKPQEAIPEVLRNIRQLQKKGIDPEWLQRLKNTFVISNFMGEQSAAAVADRLGMAEITSGWQYAEDLPQLVYMATPEQVNKVFNDYLGGFKWGYMGNTDLLNGFIVPQY